MDKNFIKEVKNEVMRERALQFLLINKFKILTLVIALLIVAALAVAYKYYSNYKTNIYSAKFTLVREYLYKEDYDSAFKILDELILDANNGYNFLAYSQKASIYAFKNEDDKVIEVLEEAVKNIKVDRYYKDILRLSLLNTKLNKSNDLEEKLKLVNEAKNNISKGSVFYYNMLEIYASVLVENKKYPEALAVYSEIEFGKDVPSIVKERSERVKNLILYYK